jgi:hypothetical protein
MYVRPLATFVSLCFLLSSSLSSAAPYEWDRVSLWEGAVKNVLDFFQSKFDRQSGSYPSEIDANGNLTSDAREPVPLGRLIYANAQGPSQLRNLNLARANADFLVKNLMAKDDIGIWFRSAVDAKGAPKTSAALTFLFSNKPTLSRGWLVY